MESPTETVRVFFNGACPICRTEIRHYRDIADRHGVTTLAWTDVTERAGALEAWGVDDDAVIRRLHVVGGDNRLLAGVDAFIEIWRRLPRYGWLARIAAVGWVKPLAETVYDRLLAPALYRWNKAKGRVPPVAASS